MVLSEGISIAAFFSVATSLGSHANVRLVDEGDGAATAAAGSGMVGAADGVGGGDAEWATARRQERINIDIWARSVERAAKIGLWGDGGRERWDVN